MNRCITGKTVKQNQERCLSGGVNVIAGMVNGGGLKTKKGPMACVLTFFKENKVRLLQFNKEGGFIMFSAGAYDGRALRDH